MNIRILDKQACIPKLYSKGASRYDLVCFEPKEMENNIVMYRTGLAFEIPKGVELTIVPRSSTFKNYGLLLANSIGVIDSDYRGEVFVLMYKTLKTFPKKPVRLVQLKIELSSLTTEWYIVDSFDETERGDNGFGSTGK